MNAPREPSCVRFELITLTARSALSTRSGADQGALVNRVSDRVQADWHSVGDVILQINRTRSPMRSGEPDSHELRARWAEDVLRARWADLRDRVQPAVTNIYSSPLAERYASQAMLELWSSSTRHGLWRRLWLALAESERELGIPIPDDAIKQMRANLDKIDFKAVAAYEKRFRHDVMAHVHAFGDVAPAAKPFIHLGATSAYVTDNADLILMRRGLDLLRGRVLDVLRSLQVAEAGAINNPRYTHLQRRSHLSGSELRCEQDIW